MFNLNINNGFFGRLYPIYLKSKSDKNSYYLAFSEKLVLCLYPNEMVLHRDSDAVAVLLKNDIIGYDEFAIHAKAFVDGINQVSKKLDKAEIMVINDGFSNSFFKKENNYFYSISRKNIVFSKTHDAFSIENGQYISKFVDISPEWNAIGKALDKSKTIQKYKIEDHEYWYNDYINDWRIMIEVGFLYPRRLTKDFLKESSDCFWKSKKK